MNEFFQPATQWLMATMGLDIDWKQVFLIGMTPIFLLAFMIEYVVQKIEVTAHSFTGKKFLPT